MVVGDPGLIVVLVGASAGGAGRFGSGKGLDLNNLLGLLGAGSTGSTSGLREKSLDPSLVDKVERGAKQTSQEEVEEDTTREHELETRQKKQPQERFEVRTYIWGSRRLVGASTMVAGPVWARTW